MYSLSVMMTLLMSISILIRFLTEKIYKDSQLSLQSKMVSFEYDKYLAFLYTDSFYDLCATPKGRARTLVQPKLVIYQLTLIFILLQQPGRAAR